MSSETKGMDLTEKMQDELKSLEEKNEKIIEQIRIKNEELSKLRESALIILGAKSVINKFLSEC